MDRHFHGRISMRPVVLVGIILIIIGIVALAYQGFTYTTREKVVDVGPLKVEAKREKTVPLPPIVGGVAVAAGLILVIVGSRR
jgi:uncharacterized membrane protein